MHDLSSYESSDGMTRYEEDTKGDTLALTAPKKKTNKAAMISFREELAADDYYIENLERAIMETPVRLGTFIPEEVQHMFNHECLAIE